MLVTFVRVSVCNVVRVFDEHVEVVTKEVLQLFECCLLVGEVVSAAVVGIAVVVRVLRPTVDAIGARGDGHIVADDFGGVVKGR
jgi:hypothetical protein